MSQTTQPNHFLHATPSQWDPAEILSLRPKIDGRFNCSGVKKKSNTPCHWELSEDSALHIGFQLESMSRQRPQDAIQHLDELAARALCDHHRDLQQRVKTFQWRTAIGNIQFTHASSDISELEDPSTPQQPETTPTSISSLPAYSTIASGPAGSYFQRQGCEESFSAAESNFNPLQKQICDLEEKVTHQTDRIDILESICNARSSEKTSSSPWKHLKARFLALLKRHG
ncbi:unnamed protein product [Periconia digitata]|uniref:Uncharacterized protein n=1 Tax=Periconia digitata TaxID=1303443 RepID=A0A9W4UVX5_9PLEO|nr:unnamed protein product [Periconia digitata]